MSIILMGTIMGNGSVTLTTTVVAQPDGFFLQPEDVASDPAYNKLHCHNWDT
ncbi:hypothetical protein SB96558_1374 [Shigella boydii 965-58]|nr:hypothetical protein SB96558_1374 [Shigella boydii 965-58]